MNENCVFQQVVMRSGGLGKFLWLLLRKVDFHYKLDYFEKGIKKWLKIICARVENLLAIGVILVLEVRSLNSRTSG